MSHFKLKRVYFKKYSAIASQAICYIDSREWRYGRYPSIRQYSPEQITGRLRYLGWEGVPSHERIDISQRPAVIEARQRLSDYEGDTVIGKGHKGALLTLVDRTTREIKIKALPNRKADAVTQACIELLACEKPQSITFDNGKEFAQHQSIAEALNTTVYFARSYHSWERGSNENANGLIRQFLPKSVLLDKLTADFVQAVEDNLNSRPRKILVFQTPLEVKSTFGRAALQC